MRVGWKPTIAGAWALRTYVRTYGRNGRTVRTYVRTYVLRNSEGIHNAATLLTIKYRHVAAGFFHIVLVIAKLAPVICMVIGNRLSCVFGVFGNRSGPSL